MGGQGNENEKFLPAYPRYGMPGSPSSRSPISRTAQVSPDSQLHQSQAGPSNTSAEPEMLPPVYQKSPAFQLPEYDHLDDTVSNVTGEIRGSYEDYGHNTENGRPYYSPNNPFRSHNQGTEKPGLPGSSLLPPPGRSAPPVPPSGQSQDDDDLINMDQENDGWIEPYIASGPDDGEGFHFVTESDASREKTPQAQQPSQAIPEQSTSVFGLDGNIESSENLKAVSPPQNPITAGQTAPISRKEVEPRQSLEKPKLPERVPEWQPPDHPPPSHQNKLETNAPLSPNRQPPALPERIPEWTAPAEKALPVPPAESSGPSGTTTLPIRSRAETYQIKQIRWLDQRSPRELRMTPIMVQNANGPCPLLALVNGLTLSTPENVDSGLVTTLRTREQISLGLLLDAVFDELMSGRRGASTAELPDVTQLYSFLLNLHTGMNVNPAFTGEAAANFQLSSLEDRPGHAKPGTFEFTREMKFYNTFAIPLVHGWLLPSSHPWQVALERSAKTYEDAQNLMFREDELNDKATANDITEEETVTRNDIQLVKLFLNAHPTQLTEFGLACISDWMAAAGIAILFRNDHFSTLFKHPETGQLLSLITDAGYANHEEIVWESLVDVSGEGGGFYSGDFRPTGSSNPLKPAVSSGLDTGPQDGWTTVSRGKKPSASTSSIPVISPQQQGTTSALAIDTSAQSAPQQQSTPTHHRAHSEQEDADLALAMQLQEEEEHAERERNTRRQREEQATESFLANTNNNNSNTSSAQRTPIQSPRPALSPINTSNNGSRTSINISSPSPTFGNRLRRRPDSRRSSLPLSPAASSPSEGRPFDLRRMEALANSSSPTLQVPPQPPRPGMPHSGTTRPVDPDGPTADAPPPTYEEASLQTEYVPPIGSPYSATSPLSHSISTPQTQNGLRPAGRTHANSYSFTRPHSSSVGSAYEENSSANGNGGQRRSNAQEMELRMRLLAEAERRERERLRVENRDKDCVVM